MVLETVYGQYTVTGTRARTVLDSLILLNENSLTTLSQKEFYHITGAAPSSHGPVDKLNDMVRFRVLFKQNQTFTVTELGQAFLHSDGAERPKVTEKIIRNIPLWNALLDMMGPNPSLEQFSVQVRQITQANNDLIDRNLTRLFSAYIGDVECIHKTPPYGKVSPLTGKTRPSKEMQSSSDPYCNNRVKSNPFVSDEPDNTLPDTTIKMSITYGTHHVEITDELSYRFAEQMMVMIKKELVRRGVRFAF